MAIKPRTIAHTLIGIFCLLVLGQVVLFSFDPGQLNAACAAWTNGDDSVTCTGTVTATQDFLLGNDTLVNEGTLTSNFGEGGYTAYSDIDGYNDVYSFIATNSGNSNDNTSESITNNGTIFGDIPGSLLTDGGNTGVTPVGTVIFFDNVGGSSDLVNNGTLSGVFDGVGLSDAYLVYKPRNSVLNITNTGIMDIAHDNARMVSSIGNLNIINSGRFGTTTYNQSQGVFMNASSTINNTSAGTWYTGVSGSSYQDTFINRGTFAVPVGPYFSLQGGNDVFLQNLSTGSFSGRVIGGGGNDTFVLEVDSAAHTSFDRSDFDLQQFKYFETRGSGVINIDTTYTLGAAYDDPTFVRLTVYESTLSASSSVRIDGDLTVNTTGGLYITLDSDTPTTTSRFTITGAAVLDGSLTVTDDGASLTSGQSYILLDAASVSGTFDTTTLPTLTSGLSWNISYAGNAVTLSITGSPTTSSGGSGGGRSGPSVEDELEANRKTYVSETESVVEDTLEQDQQYEEPTTSTPTTSKEGIAPQADGVEPLVKPVLDICPIFTSYLFPGRQNSETAVLKWQAFLTEQIGLTVPWSGTYDSETVQGTKQFQSKYADYILKPWGILEPTGNVYKTTRAFANWLLGCKEPETNLEGAGSYELLFLDIWGTIS